MQVALTLRLPERAVTERYMPAWIPWASLAAGVAVLAVGASIDHTSSEALDDAVTDPIDDEACDAGDLDGDGVAVDAVDCDFDCSPVQCGDGYTNQAADEQCDAGDADGDGVADNAAFCDLDCTLPVCGDRLVNAAADEACDEDVDGDGIADDTTECGRDCTEPVFGAGAAVSVSAHGALTFDVRYNLGLRDWSRREFEETSLNRAIYFTVGYQTDLSLFLEDR